MNLNEVIRKEYYETSLIKTHEELINNIPKIESLFRNSKLYKNYIASIREGLQIKNCAFFEDKDFEEVELQLHHILQLYNIVLLVGIKKVDELKENEFLTIFDILNGVIEFHLKDYPIVIMLSTTLHQLYHTGQYSLPKDSKQFHPGNYKGFIEEYEEYLDKEEICKMYSYFNIDVSKYFKETGDGKI